MKGDGAAESAGRSRLVGGGLVGIRCDRPGQGPLGVKQGGQAGVTRWA